MHLPLQIFFKHPYSFAYIIPGTYARIDIHSACASRVCTKSFSILCVLGSFPGSSYENMPRSLIQTMAGSRGLLAGSVPDDPRYRTVARPRAPRREARSRPGNDPVWVARGAIGQKKLQFDAVKRMSDARTLPSLPMAAFYNEPEHYSLGQRWHQDHSRQHPQPLPDQAYLRDGACDRMKVMDKAAI